MRYPASGKLEIIRIVERSHLPVKQTLAKIDVSRPTFYRWYDLAKLVLKTAVPVRSGRAGTVSLMMCVARLSRWRSKSRI